MAEALPVELIFARSYILSRFNETCIFFRRASHVRRICSAIGGHTQARNPVCAPFAERASLDRTNLFATCESTPEPGTVTYTRSSFIRHSAEGLFYSRPYACTYCDRSFTQSNDLTLHIRRHTGEKPYVCGVCNERFIQGTALKAHQRITGHFDDGTTQPERFASISVNNPNRVENSGPKAVRTSPGASGEGIPKVVKPVKSRKKTKQTASSSSSTAVSSQPMISEPPATVVTSPPTLTVSSAPTSPGDNSSTGKGRPPPHPSSLGLNNLSGTPHGYVPVPYIMQNYDLASTGLFSQNFSQQ